MDVVKRLSFGDQSLPLSQRLDQARPVSDLREQLDDLSSTLRDLQREADNMARTITMAATDKAHVGSGGLQTAMLQLKSLKTSWLNLEQQCAFAEAIKVASCDSDFKQEHDSKQLALVGPEAALKELKAANREAEENLRRGAHEQYDQYKQYTALVTEAVQAVQAASQGVEAYETGRPESPVMLQTLQDEEAEIEAALAQASRRAAELEVELASELADVADLQSALAAEVADAAAVRAEIASLEAVKSSKVAAAAAGPEAALKWCEEALKLVAQFSGLSINRIDEDELQLRFTTHIEHKLADAEGTLNLHTDAAATSSSDSGNTGSTKEHVLLIQLVPGSSRVLSARITPMSIDIQADVVAAAGRPEGLGLVHLVSAVRAQLLRC